MPQFQIIQLKDPTDPTTLQFPVTPVESLVQSVNSRSTPFIIMIAQWSDTPTTPTAANQYAYKPTSKVVCVSSASGTTFVWSAGTAPVEGKLYMWNGTLYVKSIQDGVASLSPLVLMFGQSAQPTEPHDDPGTLAPTVSHSPTTATNGNVTITVQAGADATSICYRRGTSGAYTTVQGTSATVTATENGTWYFYAVNNTNTWSPVTSHTISNIDKTPPDIRLWGYDSSTTLAETYCSASAYNEPNLPIYWMYSENGTTYGATNSYNPTLPLARNGYYKYFATDAAGNTGEAILHLTNLATDEERD